MRMIQYKDEQKCCQKETFFVKRRSSALYFCQQLSHVHKTTSEYSQLHRSGWKFPTMMQPLQAKLRDKP
ncbi:CLUMA_CG021526, isoform A [Clunio marinus]|uniref:CLUMA_CG021526, isoform A n=1 Tax=Clunio marinus TaxID=568069 RepID=A0A1J1J8I7_9DIPT|nr:CLUMA_CG021526, isoform A [Clunio marinus]